MNKNDKFKRNFDYYSAWSECAKVSYCFAKMDNYYGVVLKTKVSKNNVLADKYETVTKVKPSKEQLKDMEFGMKIVKNMKSNAIVIVKDGQTLASGCGQTSRIWALKNALENNKDKDFKGAVLASDAFFPFDDCVTLANEYGISAVVQPGGSIKDQDSIDACDKYEMTMVFTGTRHFKH